MQFLLLGSRSGRLGNQPGKMPLPAERSIHSRQVRGLRRWDRRGHRLRRRRSVYVGFLPPEPRLLQRTHPRLPGGPVIRLPTWCVLLAVTLTACGGNGSGCPSERPKFPGGACDFEVSCSYGEQCCCGECHPELICRCEQGQVICVFTDDCMAPRCMRDASPLKIAVYHPATVIPTP